MDGYNWKSGPEEDQRVVGFTGARNLHSAYRELVGIVVRDAIEEYATVAVGCAQGLDAFVRFWCPAASRRVFGVSPALRSRLGPGAFAARSQRLVSWVAAHGGSFVAFVNRPCPAGVSPARSWRSGRPGSGSWSSLALAAGLGCPVAVVVCGPRVVLPAWPGWSWVAGSVARVPCFWLVLAPVARQPVLF